MQYWYDCKLCFSCDTCCLYQSIPTILCSLILVVMSLMLCIWSPLMYHKRKVSLWPCYKAKILLVCFMTLFGYHALLFSTYFVRTCFFKDINLSDLCLLRNLYTWEMVHLYVISHFFGTHLVTHFDYSVATGKNLAMSACLILLHLFALIFGWSQALTFTCILLSLWTYVFLFWYISSIVILWIFCVGMPC